MTHPEFNIWGVSCFVIFYPRCLDKGSGATQKGSKDEKDYSEY